MPLKRDLLISQEILRTQNAALRAKNVLMNEEVEHLRKLLQDSRVGPGLLEALGRTTDALAHVVSDLKRRN